MTGDDWAKVRDQAAKHIAEIHHATQADGVVTQDREHCVGYYAAIHDAACRQFLHISAVSSPCNCRKAMLKAVETIQAWRSDPGQITEQVMKTVEETLNAALKGGAK
jgi:hypothetical protein